MGLFPGQSASDETPAPFFRRARQGVIDDSDDNAERKAGLPRHERRLAQARRDGIEDHARFAGLGHPLRELANEEQADDFGDDVAAAHTGVGFVVEGVEDPVVIFFGEIHAEERAGVDDGQARDRAVRGGGFLKLRQGEEGEEEGADDVDGQGGFVVLDELELCFRNARVLHQGVQAIEAVKPLGERLDRRVAGHVQVPDLDDAMGTARGLLNLRLGVLPFGLTADGEDEFLRLEAGEVTGSFETEARVRAGHDDGLAREIGRWDGEVCE